jgi:glycerol-3-phosphate dehydrogenase
MPRHNIDLLFGGIVTEQFDVIIIGGGVVGCMAARFLSRFDLDILVIEKDADIGMGASSANSAIIHAGYDPTPGSLKAKMNVAANSMWDTLAGELNFAFERRGDYVVAVGKEEFEKLESLLDQGRRNGVPGMRLISADEMRSREPEITPLVSGAVWAPTGGLCDPFGVTIAAAENALQNGVKIYLDTKFESFIMIDNRIMGVKTNRSDFKCRWVINAAGVYADEVMHKAGVRLEFKIIPRRGEYCVLDKAEVNIRNVLFPVPSEKGKGILVTTTLHGNALVGPNASEVDEKDEKEVSENGLNEIWEGAHKLVPGLNSKAVIAVFAGLRAFGNAPCETPGVDYQHDFIIERPKNVLGFINLGGIESPGLSSAPAIAQQVVDLLIDGGEVLRSKPDWHPIRPPRPRFRDLPREEQLRLVQKDARYGRVICRCETITEGEIIAELNAPIPARTYDAIKRRTWLGTGRCLGSFDMPRVINILARELNLTPLEISKKGKGSEFLTRMTKEIGVTDGH